MRLLAGKKVSVKTLGERKARDLIKQQRAGRIVPPTRIEPRGVDAPGMRLAEGDKRRHQITGNLKAEDLAAHFRLGAGRHHELDALGISKKIIAAFSELLSLIPVKRAQQVCVAARAVGQLC